MPGLPSFVRAEDMAGAEACLINFYDFSARMGLHQDRDEPALAAPVVAVSLGDSCRFRHGGLRRGDPAKKLELCSGDAGFLTSTRPRAASIRLPKFLTSSTINSRERLSARFSASEKCDNNLSIVLSLPLFVEV